MYMYEDIHPYRSIQYTEKARYQLCCAQYQAPLEYVTLDCIHLNLHPYKYTYAHIHE